jgi:hypothetical protein
MSSRAAIAAALSTVADVRGHEYRPSTPRAGDAWPLLGSLDRSEGLTFIRTWRVLVFLPQDERSASDWIDAHQEALVNAMEGQDVGFVDRLEPVALASSGGDQYGLQITMRSE